jgi:hypothetical protein
MFECKGNSIRQIAGKAMLLLLVSVYLLFSIGIIKATHLCMGREASVVFFTAEAKKCACSIFAAEKDSCCDDEHELLRIENAQKVISVFSLPFPELFVLEELYINPLTDHATAGAFRSGDWLEEQLPPKIPLWKINCSLVFYDDDRIA